MRLDIKRLKEHADSVPAAFGPLERLLSESCLYSENAIRERSRHKRLKTGLTVQIFCAASLSIVSFASPISVQEAKAQAVPTNPAEPCRANWFREVTARKQFAFSNNAVNPTAHEMRRITTDMGPNHWYALNGSWDSTTWAVNVSSTTEPGEDTRGLPNGIGEVFYGVAYFKLEPGTNTIIPIRDGGLFEGHAFADLKSDGEQIARFPALTATGGGNHYFASFTNNNNTRNQSGDVKVNPSWSSNGFVVPVPADGDVYIHQIVVDELSSSRVAMRYCPQDFSDAPASYGAARHTYEPDLLLGALKDVDLDLTGNATASSDDTNGKSDEDGISAFSPLTTITSTYSVTANVTNAGAAIATLSGWIDFDQSGTFDAGEYQAIGVPAGTNNASVTLSWTGLSGLTAGNTFARFRLTTAALTSANAASSVGDGEVEDYALTITLPPPEADLVTLKTLISGDSTPNEGDTVTFNIAVRNDGPSDATNVTLTDLIPSGLSATGNNGVVTAGNYTANTGIWTIPTLANGATATLTIEGEVDAGQLAGTAIQNLTTAATADQPDPEPINGNDLEETVSVASNPNLAITKDANDDELVTVGQIITYTYTVTNTGNEHVRDIAISDTHNAAGAPPVPGNEALLTDNGTQSDSTDVSVDGSWDVLAPGDVITFIGTYTVTQADIDNLQ